MKPGYGKQHTATIDTATHATFAFAHATRPE
jgi:hypothetical protein